MNARAEREIEEGLEIEEGVEKSESWGRRTEEGAQKPTYLHKDPTTSSGF